MQRCAPVRLVASTSSQSARFMRMTSVSRVMPALLTRISILPNRAIAAFVADLMSSSLATSILKAAAFPPAPVISPTTAASLSWLRAASATAAPASASASAQERPMPCEAPVTSATCPSRLVVGSGMIAGTRDYSGKGRVTRLPPAGPGLLDSDRSGRGADRHRLFRPGAEQAAQHGRRHDGGDRRHEDHDGVGAVAHDPHVQPDQG